MVCLATVGTSAITEHFLNACKTTKRYCFHACYSRSPEKAAAFAEKFGFSQTYTSLEEMARDPQVDAVYIASPNGLHYGQSKLFLEHGKHVICEKPIATCASEYEELLQLANSKGLIYMEAIISRHAFGREILTDALKQIGTISQARIDYCQRSSRYDAAMAGKYANVFDVTMAGGALMDLGVYCVYGALDLFGPPLDVKASATFLPNGADIAGSALLTYPGFLATLSYSKAGQGCCGTEIIGDRGVVKVGSISQYGDIRLIKDGNETLLLHMPTRNETMSGEARRFADYISSQSSMDYTEICLLTRQVHQCMDAIKNSSCPATVFGGNGLCQNPITSLAENWTSATS